MKYDELHAAYLEADADGDIKRESAAVMAMLLEDLAYPPSADGKAVVDLSWMRASVARHLGRRGWRWHPEKAYIKKRSLHAPGTYEDACAWVDVDEPDDPLEDLNNMTMAEIDSLPEEVMVEAKRRLGILPQAEPQGEPWQESNNVAITNTPDTADDGAVWH